VNGHVIDSAFTVTHNDRYDPLVEATRRATDEAVALSGPGRVIEEVGDLIDEIISSYEIELDGKKYAINPVRNLTGHTTGPYQVHASMILS
ncbi:peptidase M24A, methionine aminopeptidase, subfamily 2, partial [Kipferlia bialata]